MANGGHDATLACLNCGAIPAGAWCQSCGQRAGLAHRSLLHLAHELAELLTHADSRLWRTLRDLTLHPARLTRGYLAGRRASQIPPMRLFFVILLVLFAAGSVTNQRPVMTTIPQTVRTQLDAKLAALSTGAPRLDAWLKPHLHAAIERPDAVVETMLDWLERFTLLMLPIAAVMLWGLTAFVRPRFTLFDHLVFGMHSLGFAGMVQSAVFLLSTVLSSAGVLLLLLPVHLFRHMRGVYGGSAALTLLRMALLGLGSLLAVVVLLVALAVVGLQLGAGAG